jgi:cyclase
MIQSMHRREVLQAFLAAAFGGGAVSRLYAQPAALTLAPLGKNLQLLSGAGGNMALLASKDGLLMIDSGLPDTAAAVTAKATSVMPKILVLINTHWHYDHVGGNTDIGKMGAKLIAHVNVQKRLSTPQKIVFMKMDFPALPKEGQPSETFTDRGHLTFAGEKVAYHHLPPAHTDGDTVIHFEHDNVVHCGDLYFNGLYPFIDYSSGGNIEGMIANSARILKMVDAQTKIIPGHGPLSNKAELQEFHDVLVGVNENVSKLVKEGKPLDQVVAAKPTAKWDDKWGKAFLKPEQVVAMLYQGKTAR